MSFVYVCYEANWRECALEAGPVNEVEVYGYPELAVKWVRERIQCAYGNGFVEETAADISESGVLEKVKLGYFSVEMYHGHQENYDYEYDIVVERKEVQVSEEQKETEGYKMFKNILAENISAEALEQYDLGNSDELLRENVSDVVMRIATDKICPKCGSNLFFSDLPKYDYVCTLCDENFYECEVKE